MHDNPHDVIRAQAAARPAQPVATYGRKIQLDDWRTVTVCDEGVTIERTGPGACRHVFGLIPDALVAAAADFRPYECPVCGASPLLYLTTRDGFDYVHCPECQAQHRRTIGTGLSDHVCQRCRVVVDVLEERGGVEACRACVADMDAVQPILDLYRDLEDGAP